MEETLNALMLIRHLGYLVVSTITMSLATVTIITTCRFYHGEDEERRRKSEAEMEC